jgi:N-formylglutamate amidohydrolase
MTAPFSAPAFDRSGPAVPTAPVVVSVPHAGRDYPAGLERRLRVPVDRLAGLEDRHVDKLAASLHLDGVSTLIARAPRAWIDLNRAESEIDPGMVSPPPKPGTTTSSAKVRGGLGLIPRRLSGCGELWHDRLTVEEIEARITAVHRPYHAALHDMLVATRARHGVAVLVDLHSMPPIGDQHYARPPQIVIGDRFGRSAASRFTSRLVGEAAAAGFAVAENSPYAGGYILDRHGAPATDIHAVQIEIDRSLYLAPDMRTPDPAGVARMRTLVRTMIRALIDESMTGPTALAAE